MQHVGCFYVGGLTIRDVTSALTIVTVKVVLLEETVGEEGDVLSDVMGEKLREGAGDAIGLDCEGDPVLGSLHKPRVVVHNGQCSLLESSREKSGSIGILR